MTFETRNMKKMQRKLALGKAQLLFQGETPNKACSNMTHLILLSLLCTCWNDFATGRNTEDVLPALNSSQVDFVPSPNCSQADFLPAPNGSQVDAPAPNCSHTEGDYRWVLNQFVDATKKFVKDPVKQIKNEASREVCMGELGCFNAGPPFFDLTKRPFSPLPVSREVINTLFLLYTPRSDPKHPVVFSNLDNSIDGLGQSTFDPSRRTTVLVPGYFSIPAPGSLLKADYLIQAILNVSGNNVFMVDWTGGDGLLYGQACSNARVTGAEIALFIRKLQAATGVRPESFHLIGHSLGCHVAGYAGKLLKNLGRITALDAAGPYFTDVDPVVRLHRTDALFVDAIHTNDAPVVYEGLGLGENIGHLDFYPNGGIQQTGCRNTSQAIKSFILSPTLDRKSLAVMFGCSHMVIVPQFSASVYAKCPLTATLCGSWEDYRAGNCPQCRPGEKSSRCVPMGWYAEDYPRHLISNKKSLTFYLSTTADPPYCDN